MGASIGTFWTTKELQNIAEIQSLQELGVKFITETIFFGIPVRSGRKPYDPISLIWIEPSPEVVEGNMDSLTKETKVRLSS